MQILVVAATEFEIRPFIESHQDADVLIAGVGIPSTIYHLQKRLAQIDYDFVIQAGIAGTFDQDLPLTKTVIIQKDCFADIGVENYPGIFSLFDMELANPSQFPFTDGWLLNDNIFLQRQEMPLVNGITVNTIHTNKQHLDFFKQRFSASVESMEGAALHYVCLQEQIPFIQLRSISNIAGDRDKANWKIKESVASLNENLSRMYSSLTHKNPKSP
jgi:futalosine hydrolase